MWLDIWSSSSSLKHFCSISRDLCQQCLKICALTPVQQLRNHCWVTFMNKKLCNV